MYNQYSRLWNRLAVVPKQQGKLKGYKTSPWCLLCHVTVGKKRKYRNFSLRLESIRQTWGSSISSLFATLWKPRVRILACPANEGSEIIPRPAQVRPANQALTSPANHGDDLHSLHKEIQMYANPLLLMHLQARKSMTSNPWTPKTSVSALGLKGRLSDSSHEVRWPHQHCKKVKTWVFEFSSMTFYIYLSQKLAGDMDWFLEGKNYRLAS